jgi:hypothetical protein
VATPIQLARTASADYLNCVLIVPFKPGSNRGAKANGIVEQFFD